MKTPRQILLSNFQSPGDVLMLTAAVRDLHLTYPGEFQTGVLTSSPALWENNPYLTPGISGEAIQCEYPLVNSSDRRPYHFVHAFRKFLNDKLGLNIEPGGALDSGELDNRGIRPFAGDLHLSDREKGWLSQVDEITGKEDSRFWIIVAGGKTDYTAKWWSPARYQEVVDHFKGKIQFVQAGAIEPTHIHTPLRGVIDLVGKTDLRQLVRLIYHADGIICPVTFFMHAAAALPPKKDRHRACVVIAGGRESNTWESYQGQQYLHTVGALPCCRRGGCWRSRVIPLPDGDADKNSSLCERPVNVDGVTIPKCLDMITTADVIRAVEKYTDLPTAAFTPAIRPMKSPALMVDAVKPKPPDASISTAQSTSVASGAQALFITVTDANFFSGTLAAINSLLAFHPAAEIAVVISDRFGAALSEPQTALLQSRCRVYPAAHFDKPGRVLGAWQLKAYAVNDLPQDRKCVVLFDSDLFFCGDVQDIIGLCVADGKMRGGNDGDGCDYDRTYAPYGFPVPAKNPMYMSTSCCFIPTSDTNRRIVEGWSKCTDRAEYGPQPEKVYRGHGDQGVLNAVIYAETRGDNVELLPNRLWSQHWCFDQDVIDFRGGKLVNLSDGSAIQRTIHCGGSDKFWKGKHSERRRAGGQSQRWAYAAFLGHLFLGQVCDPSVIAEDHLFKDLAFYHQLIRAMRPDFAEQWSQVGHRWLNRCVAGIPRAMTLNGSASMDKYIELARSLPAGAIIVEVGSLFGGSVVTLALAMLDRWPVIYSVDSFMGNGDNTVDGGPLPSLDDYIGNVKTAFPFLNINAMQLPSVLAADLFADGSIDMVFIDGNHATAAVLADIAAWLPKLKSVGILAGDDIGWESVRAAVSQALPDFESGQDLWWNGRG